MEDPLTEENTTHRVVKVVGGWEFIEPEDESYFNIGRKPEDKKEKDTFEYTIFDDKKD